MIQLNPSETASLPGGLSLLQVQPTMAALTALAAGDGFEGKVKRNFGGLAGANGNPLGLDIGPAFTDNFGGEGIEVISARFESRRNESPTSRRGVGHVAVDAQASVGGDHDNDRGRSRSFGLLLRHLRLGGSLGFARAPGASSAGAGAVASAAAVAPTAEAAEEPAAAAVATAVATMASRATAMARAAARSVAAVPAVARTMAGAAATMAEQTAQQSAAAMAGATTVARTMAGRGAVAGATATVRTPTAAAEQVGCFGATSERHHQHNTVHRVHLQQTKREANPRNSEEKPQGLEPSGNAGLPCPRRSTNLPRPTPLGLCSETTRRW